MKHFDQFAAARNLQTPTWIYDIDACCIIYANASACELWQAKDEAELQERDMSAGMSPTVAKRLKQYQTDFNERAATFTEMWTLYPNGKPTSVMVRYSGFWLLEGRMAMQCEVFTEADDQPDNLRSAEALLHTDVMIILYRHNGPPLYMNPAARNVSHDAKAPLVQLFVDPEDFDILSFELDGSGEHRRVARVNTIAGQRWFDVSAKQCRDAITGEPAILVTAIDVSELKDAKDQARYLASSDQLTGCFNRSHLQYFATEKSDTGAEQRALLYFDIDRFKQINDTFGHEMGDAVLIKLAERAQGLITPEDFVVRLGGDEFVILIRDTDDQAAFLQRVESIFHSLSRPVQFGTAKINAKISMGITMCPAIEFDVETALREADVALYMSKKEGRNRFTFYDEAMGEAAERRIRIETEIESALLNREFTLHYQPRVDVRTGKIASVEGLARWMHPERGLVLPNEFIPICEETGMIEALGEQVLEIGFAQAVAWRNAGSDTRVSLNISPRQFSDSGLLDTLKTCTQAKGFTPGQIELEITESVLIGEHDGISAKLQAITDMGFEIAIDDFGTGYSNLSYISRFPLNSLKIDHSFIAQLPHSGPIIKLILALAKEIDVKTVAEGVETKEQFEWLSRSGCDQIQGYYFAKPASASEIEAMLENSIIRTDVVF